MLQTDPPETLLFPEDCVPTRHPAAAAVGPAAPAQQQSDVSSLPGWVHSGLKSRGACWASRQGPRSRMNITGLQDDYVTRNGTPVALLLLVSFELLPYTSL
jgi:hypothetical protein